MSSGKVEEKGEGVIKEDRSSTAMESECSVGCFSSSSRSASASTTSREVVRQQSQDRGRNCCSALEDASRWKCPDPGCKTNNQEGQGTCSNCRLPRHSANQFKRSQSKILKQL